MNGKRTFLLALAAAVLTLAALWYIHRPVIVQEATMAQVRDEAARGGYRLINTAELAQLYQQPPANLLLVDTRQDWEYRSGHIKGAVNFPLEPTWWSRWRAKGSLAALLGPNKDRLAVFYWAGLAWVRSDAAARVAVQLGYKNIYRDPLGFPEWQKSGLPVASDPLGLCDYAPEAHAPGLLSGWALVWTMLGVFAGGLALNLTPCVYPLIPITVSYFGGKSGLGRGRLLIHGLLYLAGLTVTNSLLGVGAALTGGLMGAMLQNPLVLAAVAAVLVVLAASMFGFWELRLPGGLTQAASRSYAGYCGSLFMGLTLGVVAAPCIGPFVLGLLTWVASLGSPLLGFLVFFTLSLGLGLPLFFLAIFSGHLEKLPRSGEWLLWVRKLMGWVLLAMAAYFLRPLLPESVSTALLAGVALAAALHLGWPDRTAAASGWFQWLKTAAALVGVVLATFLAGSWAFRGPGVTWQPYSDQLLTQAKAARKPVIIDFGAAWCAPCRELEEITFHHPQVVKLADRDFVMVKVDLTRKGDPVHTRLLSQYGIKGVPTVIFLDGRGNECRNLRLVDYLPPEQFLSRMAGVMKK